LRRSGEPTYQLADEIMRTLEIIPNQAGREAHRLSTKSRRAQLRTSALKRHLRGMQITCSI
jgi:hypothetical protein